jgi:hypothetical protein
MSQEPFVTQVFFLLFFCLMLVNQQVFIECLLRQDIREVTDLFPQRATSLPGREEASFHTQDRVLANKVIG